MRPVPASHESGPGAGATARRAIEPRQLARDEEFAMNDIRSRAPEESARLVYMFRALGLVLAAFVAESARSVAEIAQIIGADPDRLRAGIADPRRLDAGTLLALACMADIEVSSWLEDAEDGARFIAAQVRDGAACHRCGRAFRVGMTSRPDGFAEHGQLFRCSGGCGCSESAR